MRETYYRIRMYLSWQLLFGIAFYRHYNGYKCSAIKIELPFIGFVIDVSREVDSFFKFDNLIRR